jgi:hypothetical protein
MCRRVKPPEEVCPQAHVVRNQEEGFLLRAGTVRWWCYNMSSQLFRAQGARSGGSRSSCPLALPWADCMLTVNLTFIWNSRKLLNKKIIYGKCVHDKTSWHRQRQNYCFSLFIYWTTLWVRVNWCSFTGLGFYVGDSLFESQPEHSHDWSFFRGFAQFSQVSAWKVGLSD